MIEIFIVGFIFGFLVSSLIVIVATIFISKKEIRNCIGPLKDIANKVPPQEGSGVKNLRASYTHSNSPPLTARPRSLKTTTTISEYNEDWNRRF